MIIQNREKIRVIELKHYPQQFEKDRIKEEKHNKEVQKLLKKSTTKGKK